PIDILGGGFVVAPPSKGSYGPYQFVQGGLDDLNDLPALQGLLQPSAAREARLPQRRGIEEGLRNTTLWRRCMAMARRCDGPAALLEMALAENTVCEPPLAQWEVEKVVQSAWRYEERGLNWINDRFVVSVVPVSHGDVDDLMGKSPDAFVLLTYLRRHNFDRNEFVVANAMAPSMPGGGWPRKRLASARTVLEEEGRIVPIKRAGIRSGPTNYAWPSHRVVENDQQYYTPSAS
ncbi:primase C-terminal domain-containing protein, partial [Tardiphaga sp.]|uniref:primase C-terminal domain-containing protein n=1 Tax=Tardiphaga sp. TaxID=1926292 RepID=UPI0037D9FDF9